jgi:beta-galactosidase
MQAPLKDQESIFMFHNIWNYFCVLMLVFSASSIVCARETFLLDSDWRFALGELPQANARDFADQKWRIVNLPHDWSIEGTTDPTAPSGGDGGYFPTGEGWYRRAIEAKPEWRGKKIFLEFEGVAPKAEIWLNGVKLGEHHYAYTPFRFDVTQQLRFDEPNLLAVRVDNSQQPNSRWYTGSGIYRHVRLTVTDPVHIDNSTLSISTREISDQGAKVDVSLALINDSDSARNVDIDVELTSPSRNCQSTHESGEILQPNARLLVKRELQISKPELWSPDTPYLYDISIRISEEGETRDEIRTKFGIRTVVINAKDGLLLNGQPVELCGACVHHDNGPLGAAAFDRAEERRVEKLKAAGFNAIRTAHNPPSTAFLDACDRLGMLVIDEAFDGWAAAKKKHDYSKVFADQWQNDLRAMIDRDRNHPSVIMWSIGNEVFERGKAEGRRLAGELADYARKFDPTRPVTIGLNGLEKYEDWPKLDPVFESLDVAGYNYQANQHHGDHERVPERVIFLSESYANSAFEGWEASHDELYVIGDFVWSGIDYLGEAGIGRVFAPEEKPHEFWEESQYPWHGGACGDLDLICERKPLSHYRQILWDRGEKLYAAVQVPGPEGKPWQISKWSHPPSQASWTWPGQVGRDLTVEVYSRYPAVRLYLNDKLLGEKPTTREREYRTEFQVPYEPGLLRIVGVEDSKELESFELKTAGSPAKIQLTPDRDTIQPDGQDLSFLEVELLDGAGTLCPHADNNVEYKIDGPGEIIAVGSGDLRSQESYQANPRKLHEGRSLVVLRSKPEPGAIRITAKSPGLPEASVEIQSQASSD